MLQTTPTPEAAVESLIALHGQATAGLKACLERYFETREPPTSAERQGFCYPELRVHYEAQGVQPSIARAYAKFQGPGTYVTTIAHPNHFRRYLIEQLNHLVRDYGATLEVGISDQEIPYPYVLDRGDDLGRRRAAGGRTGAVFPGAETRPRRR